MKTRKISKKFLAIFISLCLMSAALAGFTLPASASDVTSGTTGDCTWRLDGTSLTISGSGKMENYTYSSTLPWGTDITEVTIEGTVTDIGNYAFCNCAKLENVTISKGVSTIGSDAFDNCRSLTKIVLPNSVTSIGDSAFFRCVNLTSINIPNGVSVIDDTTFYECYSLESIAIPVSVKTVGFMAFHDCISLETVYYCGTADEWIQINIDNEMQRNAYLLSATRSYHKYDNSSDTSCNLCGYDREKVYSYFTYAINGDGVSIEKCDESASDNIVIPATIEGYPVTYIRSFAFASCENITSIVISDGIKQIGEFAFVDCLNVTSIIIPTSVIKIGNCAFGGLEKLETVKYLGTEEQWNAISLSADAFSYTPNIIFHENHNYETTIVSPTCTEKGSATYTCKDCGYSYKVDIETAQHNFLEYKAQCEEKMLDADEFSKPYNVCYMTYKCANCSETKTEEYDYASHGNEGTENMPLLGHMHYISYSCPSCNETHKYYYSRKTVSSECCVYYEQGEHRKATVHTCECGEKWVYEGGYQVVDLYECDSYKETVIAPTCTDEGYTIHECDHESYKDDYVPAQHAFVSDCDIECNLCHTTRTAPAPHTFDEAFNSLCKVCGYKKPSITGKISSMRYVIKDDRVTITFCDDSISGEVVIPSEIQGYPVTIIDDRAFYECSNITSVTIPNTVTRIGYEAFYGCTGLTSITIPESVKSIFSSAFIHCTNIEKIELHDDIKYIDADAFHNTKYYNTTSNWEGNVLYIGNHLIEAKPSISGDYKIKDGTQTIAEEAFYGCDNLTSITIPDSLRIIGNYAFYECYGLKNVTMGKGVTDIHQYAFYSCSNLASIDLPNSLVEIGDYAFYECVSLDEINIPDSVKAIGSSAFSYCLDLTNVTIGKGIVYIHSEAFYECISLTSIYYKGTEEEWNKLWIGADAIPDYTEVKTAGHEHIYTSIVTAPTATSQGYTTHTCTKCGDSYVDSYTDPIPVTPPTTNSVQNMQVIAGDTDITLTWDAYPSATRYNVYVKDSTGNTIYTRGITDPTITTYKFSWPNELTWGENYSFGVRVKAASWLDTVYMDGALTVGDRVVDVKTESAGSAINVTWQAYEGATQYRVYVYEKGAYPTAFYNQKTTTNSVSIVNGIYPEVDYEVRVVATVDGTQMKTIDAISAAARLNIAKPTEFSLRGITPTKAAVGWSYVRGVDKSWVYFTPTGQDFNNNPNTIIRESKGFTGSVAGLAPNTTYDVRIQLRVTDADGKVHYSGASEVLGTVTTTGWEEVTLTAVATSAGAELSWNAHTGASEYYIYRSTNGGTLFKKIATIYDPETTSYIDTDAENGYIYAIRTKVTIGDTSAQSPLVKSNAIVK